MRTSIPGLQPWPTPPKCLFQLEELVPEPAKGRRPALTKVTRWELVQELDVLEVPRALRQSLTQALRGLAGHRRITLTNVHEDRNSDTPKLLRSAEKRLEGDGQGVSLCKPVEANAGQWGAGLTANKMRECR